MRSARGRGSAVLSGVLERGVLTGALLRFRAVEHGLVDLAIAPDRFDGPHAGSVAAFFNADFRPGVDDGLRLLIHDRYSVRSNDSQ